ncbi:MAG TPA: glycosyl hydrolase family 18 protein [Candidatus Saccharimonadales bacterium]|nr:glycosyl hydrolase family 18 protein [Candidatus Saccharimonadales bacterium]
MRRLASPRRLLGLLVVLAVLVSLLPLPAVLPGAIQPGTEDAAAMLIRPRAGHPPTLSQQVYGYLPWWNLDAGTAGRLQYDLLTTIAFFGIGIGPTGSLDRRGLGYLAFMSPDAVLVTNAAHAHGVRVVPTFQLFGSGNLRDLRAFLGSGGAQKRFIGQAIELIVARRADGANLDFEPVPDDLVPAFVSFVARFRTALRARLPTSSLVVATSAYAPSRLIRGLVPNVDALFVMAYDYRTAQSSVAGSTAPLDSSATSVRGAVERYLTFAPAKKVFLGVPYYGYDWPVTSPEANAPVQTNGRRYGSAYSLSYALIADWLRSHPKIVVRHDQASGAAWFSYRDSSRGTYRQVWFEDTRSVGAKYDFAIQAGLGGVGIWALDNDRGYSGLWNLLREKFRSPTHRAAVTGSLFHLAARSGRVEADVIATILNGGTVPEIGRLVWSVRTVAGNRAVASGNVAVSVLPGGARRPLVHVVLGSAATLPAGTYRLQLTFIAGARRWTAPAFTFHQRY